ncbi:MAG: tetratricopeptide repeat protein, partial [Desulfobulbaceae bacterium]|nr:tetratricopeptide repeat protein [Desulfobulbaceae bacterium]
MPYLGENAASVFEETLGCLDLFMDFDAKRSGYDPRDFVANRCQARQAMEAMDFDRFLLPTIIPGLAIMKAGRFDADYARHVGQFQWDRLFCEAPGLFTGYADFLRQRFKYILVDSRTGISETSGICTMLLPDKLVVVFTPNQQSLSGVKELVRKADAYRKASPDGRSLTVFPLPSRIEMARPQLLTAWRHGLPSDSSLSLPEGVQGYQPLFEMLFDEIHVRQGTSLKEYFDQVMLHHIPDYAYGEPIAVMLEEEGSAISLSSRFAALTERLVELQAPWESLAEMRLEAEIRQRCREATDKSESKDIEAGIRSAHGLIERTPGPALFEPVALAILAVARTAYPKARQSASALIRTLLELIGKNPDLAEVASILAKAGDMCNEFGDYPLAKRLFEESRWLFASSCGDEHPSTLNSMSNLAVTLLAQGDLTKAKALQEKALEVQIRVFGEEHPSAL